jgi:hypothetical protein
MVEPEILIVDEALAVGDMRFTMKCVRKMRELIEKGTSCLFVSHDLSSIVNFCKDVVWLHDGTIIQEGDPRAITMNYANFMSYGFLPPSSGLEGHPAQHNQSTELEEIAHIGYEQPSRPEEHERIPDGLQWLDVTSLPCTGVGGATIQRVALYNVEDRSNSALFVGGEKLDLFIDIIAKNQLNSPIIAADFRDRKGNLLFGLNTYFIAKELSAFHSNTRVILRFSFVIPLLLNGDYSIAVAIADGSYVDHVQHHIINEALLFKIRSGDLKRNHYLIALDAVDFGLLSAPASPSAASEVVTSQI